MHRAGRTRVVPPKSLASLVSSHGKAEILLGQATMSGLAAGISPQSAVLLPGRKEGQQTAKSTGMEWM